MAKQRMVSTRFWSDPWVVDELNPLDRYLFLYLLTNEKTNIAGVYELSLRTMSNETGIEKEELTRMMQRLESRVVYVVGWVVFKKSIKHQNYRSPKVEVAIHRELQDVPVNVLQYIEFPVELGKLLHEKYGMDTVSHLTNTKVTKLNLTNTTNVDTGQKPAKTASKDINGMFDYWEEQVGFRVKSNVKKNRQYCSTLLKVHTKKEIAAMIQNIAVATQDRFSPRVNNFIDLYYKWDDMEGWLRRTVNEQGNVVRL